MEPKREPWELEPKEIASELGVPAFPCEANCEVCAEIGRVATAAGKKGYQAGLEAGGCYAGYELGLKDGAEKARKDLAEGLMREVVTPYCSEKAEQLIAYWLKGQGL